MVCTAVTTICGVWLAYGEPPNLIMKANLYPHLGNAFFLLLLRAGGGRRLSGRRRAAARAAAWAARSTSMELDVIDANAADVRFLQATRHGEVLIADRARRSACGPRGRWREPVLARIRARRIARHRARPRASVRKTHATLLLGHFVSRRTRRRSRSPLRAMTSPGTYEAALQAELAVDEVLAAMAQRRRRAQKIGALALLPFIAMLIVHGVYHEVPLFLAVLRRLSAPRSRQSRAFRSMRALALRRGAASSTPEYYFLFPLFLSITLLTTAGFFDGMAAAHFLAASTPSATLTSRLHSSSAPRFSRRFSTTTSSPTSHRAACTGSASRVLHLFAMAQIAGYALGGCWTHIGCAQSVVAYAFIQRDLDEHYTPVQWMKEMTPVILKILLVMAAIIYAESAILGLL